MTADLIAFIEERLTEDELWAKAASTQPSYYVDERPVPATGLHWTWAVGENWEPCRVDPLEEFVGEAVGEYAPSLVTVEEWPSRYGDRTSATKVLGTDEEVPSGVGGHIVRHDPARVLREVEAKRALLAEHGAVNAMEMRGDGHGYPIVCCGMCSPTDPNRRQRYPCRTVRLLALPYSDHPDFRSEWAP